MTCLWESTAHTSHRREMPVAGSRRRVGKKGGNASNRTFLSILAGLDGWRTQTDSIYRSLLAGRRKYGPLQGARTKKRSNICSTSMPESAGKFNLWQACFYMAQEYSPKSVSVHTKKVREKKVWNIFRYKNKLKAVTSLNVHTYCKKMCRNLLIY